MIGKRRNRESASTESRSRGAVSYLFLDAARNARDEILRVMETKMEKAIRVVSVERGHDSARVLAKAPARLPSQQEFESLLLN
jgi:hypothetical protein